MDGRAVRAPSLLPVGAGLLLAALLAWVAVGRGAADLDEVGVGAFTAAWTLMMAAMMLPSLVPAGQALASVAGRLDPWRGRLALVPFVGGYLLVWAAFGLVAAELLAAGDLSAMDVAGPGATAAVIVAAAVYEVTPLKHACLYRCRHPLGLVVAHWRPGPVAPARIGVFNGAWCAGCCWALMAVLLVLGAMSVGWMLVVAAIIAVEKLLPWERAATVSVTALLLLLALGVLVW